MRELEAFVEWLEALAYVGERGHLFYRPNVLLPAASDLPVFTCHAYERGVELLTSLPFFGGLRFVPHGGKGFQVEGAFFSAFGEALERTLPILNPPKPEAFGKARELEGVLGPGELPLFAPQQYGEVPFRPFTDDVELGWVRVRELGGGSRLAPGQVLAFGYRRRRGEPAIGYGSSGGLTLEFGLERAVYKGAIEFVERDAVNLGWHSDIPPLRLRMGLREALDMLSLDGRLGDDYVMHVFLWRTDMDVYVVSAHLIHRRRGAYAYMPGVGAGVSLEEALARALGEVGQAYLFAYTVHRVRKMLGRDSRLYYLPEGADPVEADNLFRIVWYWGYRGNLERLYAEFFSRAEEADPPRGGEVSRGSHRMSLLKSALEERGLEVLVYEYAVPDPFRLVKVFIPALTQYNAPRWPYLGHPRYYDAPALLGVAHRRLGYEELRKIPVPYP